ncbi:MAG: methyltransferase domain-containing protein [Muribaculaceae bacterium]|nr:methyltransferase domain-containing protein [Muribaculaceae bacterium]
MTELPQGFIDSMRELLGPEEAEKLFESLGQPPVTSVRLNRRKPGAEFESSSPVPWCRSGLYLLNRPEFIFDPLLHAGAYYVQDASSMIYETAIEILVEEFRKELEGDDSSMSEPKLRVLDLCAAPGGKTTAMINALPEGSEVTANEYSQKRIPALRENIDRWGYEKVVVTNRDSEWFANQGVSFDIVAVDAPCSGEGMMRKEEMARTQWSPRLISQCSSLQKEILRNAVEALKPGGFLIYSTCTFNLQENEENAEFVFMILGLQPIDLHLPQEWGIKPAINSDIPAYRFMPHATKGEGLFLSIFRKPGEWVKSNIRNSVLDSTNEFPKVEVDHQTALKYLRGESLVLPTEVPKGVVSICYKGLKLGEAKNIGSRANNLFPKSRRIMKR